MTRKPIAWASSVGMGLVLIAQSATADQVTLPATKDNTLYQDAEGDVSNGSGPVFFVGSNSVLNIRRGVIAFDVASEVPAEATVDSVKLVLVVSNSSQSAAPTVISFHRILADWGEGSSSATGGTGAPAVDGDATWLHTYYPDVFWNSPGGDFEPNASASQSVDLEGTYSFTGAGFASDVQEWLDNPSSNHGWLVRGTEETPSTARRFESKESATPANQPSLVVYYTGGSDGKATSWGGIKSRPWHR